MFETRRSVSNPPKRRRKFGSSFIVETMVRLAAARVVGMPVESVSRGLSCTRDAAPVESPRVERRVAFRADAALERVD